jgi:hypothetical protein
MKFLHKPTVERPEHRGFQTLHKIDACASPVNLFTPPADKGKDIAGDLLPPLNMSFWKRLKYLFTKKVSVKDRSGGPIAPSIAVIHEQLKDDEAGKNGEPKRVFDGEVSSKGGMYADTYTTFAGCDIKIIAVPGLPTKPTREEILEAWRGPSGATPRERVMFTTKTRVIGELQAISTQTVWTKEQVPNDLGIKNVQDVVKTVGDLIYIMFDRDALKHTWSEMEGDHLHILLAAANEYGDLATMILPNVKLTSWSWGISIDDLVSEAHMEYEADEPMYWEWIPNPNVAKLSKKKED